MLHGQYEPELFPGLIYRMKVPKIVLLIFVSGKVVLTGACRLLCIVCTPNTLDSVRRDEHHWHFASRTSMLMPTVSKSCRPQAGLNLACRCQAAGGDLRGLREDLSGPAGVSKGRRHGDAAASASTLAAGVDCTLLNVRTSSPCFGDLCFCSLMGDLAHDCCRLRPRRWVRRRHSSFRRAVRYSGQGGEC